MTTSNLRYATVMVGIMCSGVASGGCMSPDYMPVVLVEVYGCTIAEQRYEGTDNPRDVLIVQASTREMVAIGNPNDTETRDTYRVPRLVSLTERSYWAYAPPGSGCEEFVVGQRKLMRENPICCDTNPSCEGPQYWLTELHPEYASELLDVADRLRSVARGDVERLAK